MQYTLFFLLGIPLWLIPVSYMLRHKGAQLSQKTSWAAMAFLAPFLIFGVGAVGTMLVQQRLGADASTVRAFGYFVLVLNLIAFFSPFALQGMFRSRFAGHQGKRVGSLVG